MTNVCYKKQKYKNYAQAKEHLNTYSIFKLGMTLDYILCTFTSEIETEIRRPIPYMKLGHVWTYNVIKSTHLQLYWQVNLIKCDY